ncbi:hypothetical protein EON65_53555 [archaeon]|nr:MAG: hypothetical protein EON65_53555 [archaeon]
MPDGTSPSVMDSLGKVVTDSTEKVTGRFENAIHGLENAISTIPAAADGVGFSIVYLGLCIFMGGVSIGAGIALAGYFVSRPDRRSDKDDKP